LGALLGLTARAAAADPDGDLESPAPDGADPDGDADARASSGVDPAELLPADAAALRADAALRDALGGGRAAGFADAGELFDVGLRHQRPSRWGRLDLAITWRRTLDDTAAGPSRRDELWLLAIWSR